MKPSRLFGVRFEETCKPMTLPSLSSQSFSFRIPIHWAHSHWLRLGSCLNRIKFSRESIQIVTQTKTDSILLLATRISRIQFNLGLRRKIYLQRLMTSILSSIQFCSFDLVSECFPSLTHPYHLACTQSRPERE